MIAPSSPDFNFALGNAADELYSYTIGICGRKTDRNPRMPRVLYDTFVDDVVSTCRAVHADIFTANGIALGQTRRDMQKSAAANCVRLVHLIRMVYDRGWISEKQRDTWQRMVIEVKWKIVNWMKSDAKRG